MDVELSKRDTVTPALGKEVSDGDKVVVTDIRVVTREEKGQSIAFDTVTRADSSMLEGKRETVRAGRAGVRDFHGAGVADGRWGGKSVDEVPSDQ